MTSNVSHCRAHEEDLALLAGGDLASEQRAAELSAHVRACAGCRELLEALQADLATYAVASTVEEPAQGLSQAVLHELAASEAASHAPRHSASRPGRQAAPWAPSWLAAVSWSAAAGVLVVVIAGVLAMDRVANPPGSQVAANAQDEQFVPVQVKRSSGNGVELSWLADGRNEPYHVLASASPRDFSSAEQVDVAGSRLVATKDLPARRLGDRKVTYFRVQ